MTDTDIIEALRAKLAVPSGRHLYGVLGTYVSLEHFAKKLQQAKTLDGQNFPAPLSVTRGILQSIPDKEFLQLVQDEAKRPEPTTAHVAQAFEKFLRRTLTGKGLVVLAQLELLFAYNLELNLLRTMAADQDRVLLLLPGKREAGRIIMFHETSSRESPQASYTLPSNLIADNNLWELR